MAAPNSRYDIVIWGATGFTGKLVAEYLLKNYGASPPNFKWALAGRSQEKLERVKEDLATAVSNDAKTLPMLTADSNDMPSLERLAGSARVVISTVGPYGIYGEKLIAACAAAGTSYCDLTGESFFVEDMIRKYHDKAKATGAKIVPSCGFDSIPADVGCFMMAEHIRRVYGRYTDQVTYAFRTARGGMSGGTAASALDISRLLWEGGRKAMAKMNDPYLLAQAPHQGAPDNSPGGLGYDGSVGGWTAPLVFAGHDSKLVHRTNSLLGGLYGPNFHYKEVVLFRNRILGLFQSVFLTLAVAIGGTMLFFPPTRALLAKYALPKPGQGPTRAQMDTGYFWVDFYARAGAKADGSGNASGNVGPLEITGVVGSDKGDCGYKETSKMLSECALCLALDRKDQGEGGVLTTAAAMGLDLVKRLRDAGMTFEVKDPNAPEGSGSAAPGMGATSSNPQEMARRVTAAGGGRS